MRSGFTITQHVFDRLELNRLVMGFESELTTRTRAGARHLLGIPLIRDLAHEARLLTLAAEALDRSPVPFRATLFDKSPESNWLVAWHQDTALPLRRRFESRDWGPWSLKAGVLYAHAPASALQQIVALRVHLDDSTSTNGPLRVLPGTHSLGLLSDEEIARLSTEIQPIECLASAGGVVAMRPLLVHASSKTIDSQPRRVLHIEYASDMTLEPGFELSVA